MPADARVDADSAQHFFPTIADRVLASAASFIILIACIGGKSAALGLFVLAAIALVWQRQRAGSVSAALEPTSIATESLLLLFAVYASLSSAWAIEPGTALRAGLQLLANFIVAQVLLRVFLRLPVGTAIYVAGWIVIGASIGIAILLAELITDFKFTRTLLKLSSEWGIWSAVVAKQISSANTLAGEMANWSVGAINLLFWPVVLLIFACFRDRRRTILLIGIGLLATIVTLISNHSTSRFALLASAISLLFAWRNFESTYRAVVFGIVSICLCIVPLSLLGFEKFELSKVEELPHSFKERIVIWGVTAQKYFDAPILGVGAKNTELLQLQIGQKANTPEEAENRLLNSHAHNMPLQTWFELGAVGALLLILVCVSMLSRLRSLHLPAAALGTAFAVSAFVLSLASWSIWNSWFSAVLGLSVAMIALGNRILDMSGGRNPSLLR